MNRFEPIDPQASLEPGDFPLSLTLPSGESFFFRQILTTAIFFKYPIEICASIFLILFFEQGCENSIFWTLYSTGQFHLSTSSIAPVVFIESEALLM